MVVPAIVAQDGGSGVPEARSVCGCDRRWAALLAVTPPGSWFWFSDCWIRCSLGWIHAESAAAPGGSNFSGCRAPAMASRGGAGQRRPLW